jgi:hypothetical protein
VAPGLISSTLAKTNFGDLRGLVDQLQKGGLDEQVKSSRLANKPAIYLKLLSAFFNGIGHKQTSAQNLVS